MADEGTATCIDILVAIILPPLGVFLKYGCGIEFWISLILTLFGYLPGIIYAVYAITK
ncbi:stress-induced hydrophobic peptide [Genlisea aurea]|uniref:Stress-induced hydrophobic peptide n=1 Tax=Genlisea aurea TaxID=192259 RepID=S8D6N1_9LAMI|nr:stress-induced hydrophobic peptide [Genlisea aurea]